MKKRILALILAMSMIFALAGCSSGSSDTTSDNSPATDSQPADDTQSGGDPSTDTTATKTGTLKIGLMVHQTGWFAGVDTPNYNEFTAMVDYVNNDLGGWQVGDTVYTIDATYADGQSDYTALRTAAMSLVDAGVDFVVETNDFWVNSCADVFEDEGIMHVSAYCVLAPDYITESNPMAFTGSNGTGGDYATAFAALAKYYPDVKSVVLSNDDNGLDETMLSLMQKYAEPYGIEVKGMVIYPGDTTDYTPIAQKLVDSGADAFLGNGSPDAYGAILKAVRAMGSDMVCACAQGKTATTLMEYAGAEASYNAFTLGPSTRESDKDQNTDILNDLVQKVTDLYGAETAATFDGAAANCLYVILQLMQKCGSVDPADVAAEWTKGGQIETIYGTGTIGGEETYGVANHAIGSPRSVSIIDPEAEDGWYFAEWIDTEIP
jgi:ABC-type branched-subunit amino acid transport system substrate-binding protein